MATRKPNEQRDKIVAYILEELPARRLWEGRITGVGYLEAFYIQVEQGRGEVVIVQSFDKGGVEVFSDRETPHRVSEILTWLKDGPPANSRPPIRNRGEG